VMGPAVCRFMSSSQLLTIMGSPQVKHRLRV